LYYADKFLGLADLFGDGCQVVSFDDSRFQEKLAASIDQSWNSAEQIRQPLLEAAARQIQSAETAYQKLYELVAGSL
jgi:colanic acid/amylovoran biosynthesis protein